jgi:hypothetical protein
VPCGDVFFDEEIQLALYCCDELHYRDFSGVTDDWEWEPCLIAFRGRLEEAFESNLRLALPDYWNVAAANVPDSLWAVSRGGGLSLCGRCASAVPEVCPGCGR